MVVNNFVFYVVTVVIFLFVLIIINVGSILAPDPYPE